MAPSKPSIHYKYIHVSMMLNADGNDVENEDNNLMMGFWRGPRPQRWKIR